MTLVNHSEITVALKALGLPLPKRAAEYDRALERLGELDVRSYLMPSADQLGAEMLRRIMAGEDIDPDALVAEHRQRADSGLAFEAVEKAMREAENGKTVETEAGVSEMLGSALPVLNALLAEVRKLGPDAPTRADQVVEDPSLRPRYLQLQELARRYSHIQRLHHGAVFVDLEGTHTKPSAWVCWHDTRCDPLVAPTTKSFGEPAGPSDPMDRLKWLASDEGQPWLPGWRALQARELEWLKSWQETEKVPEPAL